MHGGDALGDLQRLLHVEAFAEEKIAGAQALELQLAGEALEQAADLFDFDATHAHGEQVVDGELAATLFHGDDDAVHGRFQRRDFFNDLVMGGRSVAQLEQWAVVLDDLHAGFLAAADGGDEIGGDRSVAEHEDALVEQRLAADPLEGAAPQDKEGDDQREAKQEHVARDVDLRKHEHHEREQQREAADDQQQAEVDLPGGGEVLGLVEVEVVGAEDGENGEDADLQEAVMVGENVHR